VASPAALVYPADAGNVGLVGTAASHRSGREACAGSAPLLSSTWCRGAAAGVTVPSEAQTQIYFYYLYAYRSCCRCGLPPSCSSHGMAIAIHVACAC